MIIKGQARGRAKQLATHLLRVDQNERVELFECRGTLAQDVEGALSELEARGKASRSQRPLYHASISPEAATPLSRDQVRQAVDLLEERLGLDGLPRVIVRHRKEGRDHIHVVWSRVDAETGRAVPMSWNYRMHEQAARELERKFGHRVLDSSFDPRPRPKARRAVEEYELRQAERSGRQAQAVTTEISALWQGAADGKQFREELERAGYILARGDRRVFVIIDRDGNVHSLSRRLKGVTTAQLRKRLADISIKTLPSVAEVRQAQSSGQLRQTTRAFDEAATLVTRRPLARPEQGRNRATRYRTVLAPTTIAASHRRPSWQQTGLRQRKSYRASRSALYAHYAAKIADLIRTMRGEVLAAALDRLLAERQAAMEQQNLTRSSYPALALTRRKWRPARRRFEITRRMDRSRDWRA